MIIVQKGDLFFGNFINVGASRYHGKREGKKKKRKKKRKKVIPFRRT